MSEIVDKRKIAYQCTIQRQPNYRWINRRELSLENKRVRARNRRISRDKDGMLCLPPPQDVGVLSDPVIDFDPFLRQPLLSMFLRSKIENRRWVSNSMSKSIDRIEGEKDFSLCWNQRTPSGDDDLLMGWKKEKGRGEEIDRDRQGKKRCERRRSKIESSSLHWAAFSRVIHSNGR